MQSANGEEGLAIASLAKGAERRSLARWADGLSASEVTGAAACREPQGDFACRLHYKDDQGPVRGPPRLLPEGRCGHLHRQDFDEDRHVYYCCACLPLSS